MCYFGNALVGIHETSPWGDGNLADGVFVKYFSNFKNSCTFVFRKNGCITTKSKHNDR